MNQNKIVTVGSVESGDLMVSISSIDKEDFQIEIKSKFLKQYKDEIYSIVKNLCEENNLSYVSVIINDQGAIPAVIRARVIAAIDKWGK